MILESEPEQELSSSDSSAIQEFWIHTKNQEMEMESELSLCRFPGIGIRIRKFQNPKSILDNIKFGKFTMGEWAEGIANQN